MRLSRPCAVATILLVVGAGTAPAVAAGSPRAAATCQGQPATIEGDVPTLVGTPGNDVIVVGGTVHHVLAGEGDDLICVVADDRKRLDVQAGPGADVVDTTAATTLILAKMGTGADTFIGGAHVDVVSLDQELAGPVAADVVRTGDGDDELMAESAVDADLGPGDDFYIGEFTDGQGPSTVQLGKGTDVLRLDMGIAEHLRAASHPGRLQEMKGTLRLDLSTGVLVEAGVESTVSGQERVIANGQKVRVEGTAGADEVISGGCRVTMRGGGGPDVLIQVKGYDVDCGQRWARLYGEDGPDDLRASAGNDVLIGGPGLDRAYGAGGRDRCVAEKRISCER